MKKVKAAILAVLALTIIGTLGSTYADSWQWVCTSWEVVGTIGNEHYICTGGYWIKF
jgi:hypothetical protein